MINHKTRILNCNQIDVVWVTLEHNTFVTFFSFTVHILHKYFHAAMQEF